MSRPFVVTAPEWERQRRESSAAYEAFRAYRDLGPMRAVADVRLEDVRSSTISNWAMRHHWRERARAWDDHAYREADALRLDALRNMHRTHQLAGRVAIAKALSALQGIEPADIAAGVAVRLLDVGTRLERSTLATSLAELQGVNVDVDDEQETDPWDVIARELAGTAATLRHATSS